MSARVLYRDSQGRDGQVELSPGVPVYVGRAIDCAIRTDDGMVSRKHSMIRMEGGRFLIEDLGSSNGTHVNDVAVTRQPLQHNDVIQCGSMWLRYVEDAPLGAAPQQPAAVAAEPAAQKRGGTARLEVPPGGPQAAQPVGSTGYEAAYDAQPVGASAQPAPGYGQAPAAAGAAPAASPAPGGYSQPPAVSQPPLAGNSAQPVAFAGEVAAAPPGGDDRLRQQVEALRAELEEKQASYDREAADGRRLRAETATLRERIDELARGIEDRDEQVAAHGRVAEELREELEQTRADLARARGEVGEIGETVGARERQLERAQQDIARLKGEIEDQNRAIAELQRIKDDGWRKLNDQLAEIERLREVIGEQERLLEERRVGQVSQEQALIELRKRSDGLREEMAKISAERDEARAHESHQNAKISTLEEENRRLSKLLADAAGSEGGDGLASGLQLAEELKNLRVEHRKLEVDAERLGDSLERASADKDRLETRVAELEVELRDAEKRREAAESARQLADEARAKAEEGRARAEEEALAATRAKDEASEAREEAVRDRERLERWVAELESREQQAAASEGDKADEVAAYRDELGRAEQRVAELEAQARELREALSAAEARAETPPTGPSAGIEGPQGGAADAIRDRAEQVYQEINDILSEVRNNVVLVQGEFGEIARERSDESSRMIAETLESLLGSAEDAKGILRGLRELAVMS